MTAPRFIHFLPDVAWTSRATPLARLKSHAPRLVNERSRREEELLDAYTRGVADAEMRLEADFAVKLEAQKAAAENQIAEARATWRREEAARLATGFDAANAATAAALGAAVETILRPFVLSSARARAVDALVAAATALMRDGAARVRVSAPPDLLASLRAVFEDAGAPAQFEAADGCDVRVDIDGALIETRIAAWMTALEDAYGQEP